MTVDPDALARFPARHARTARFTLGSPRTMQVAGDLVLFCRSKGPEDPVLCLWAQEVATGAERLLVDPVALDTDAADLPPAERARRERARESASGIVAFSLDGAGRRACFTLAGSLFVLDIATGAVTGADLPGTVFDPVFDASGTAVAYVDGQDLCLAELGPGGAVTRRVLRSDPDPLVSHGRAEFVAAEEMRRARGFWWAPDGRRLLAARVDERPVVQWWIADPAHPDRPPQAVRYPAAGTANAAVGLELITPGEGPGEVAVASIDWSDGGRYEYLADVVWTEGRPPLVVRQSRDQRTVSVAELDEATLDLTDRRLITDDTWVELVPGSPRWARAGLVTIEDVGAARRLRLDGVSLTGDEVQVRSLVAVLDGPQGELALVTASVADEPTEVQLVAVTLADPGGASTTTTATTVLTAEPGVHGAVAEGTTVVVSAARPAGQSFTVHRLQLDPPVLDPVSATIADQGASPGFAAAPAFHRLGPDRLASALFLPSGHDGAGPLPVLLDPYGGPHAQRVLKNHHPHLVSRWFAEQGYAVLVTDGRGTPGRGPAWERAVWGDLAGPVLDDQLSALDAALDLHPFLDRDRVGIRGWSFGGYLAALAVLRRPDRFHAAVAGAPVATWELYDTHYTERYLGRPDTDPDHYRRSNLFTDLPHLERPLLLIHGLADDNVVAAHTLRFSTALLAAGAPHQVLPLSGVTHMTPQVAVAENLLRLQLDFLDRELRSPARA